LVNKKPTNTQGNYDISIIPENTRLTQGHQDNVTNDLSSAGFGSG